MLRIGAVMAVIAALSSSAEARPLALEAFFTKPATATGSFRNALDGSRRDIKVCFNGRWIARSRTLVLDEDIRFSDGERQHKTWRLTRTGPWTYTGTRDDVVGTAVGFVDDQGRVRLRYRANVGGHVVRFDDVLTPLHDGSISNTASLTAYFVHVGDVELSIRHVGRGRC
jgi:hypothetical protein